MAAIDFGVYVANPTPPVDELVELLTSGGSPIL